MKQEERLIERFYTGLRKRDWKGMGQVYHPGIFFYDPVFGNLEGPEVAEDVGDVAERGGRIGFAVWGCQVDEGYGSCQWTATYVFSLTGRKVVNKGKAMFRFEDGKIIEHQDVWSFWRWSRQALGWKGLLFGWTSVFQGTVRQAGAAQFGKIYEKVI